MSQPLGTGAPHTGRHVVGGKKVVVVIWVVGGRQSRPVKSCKDTVNIGNDEFKIFRLVYQHIKDVTILTIVA